MGEEVGGATVFDDSADLDRLMGIQRLLEQHISGGCGDNLSHDCTTLSIVGRVACHDDDLTSIHCLSYSCEDGTGSDSIELVAETSLG